MPLGLLAFCRSIFRVNPRRVFTITLTYPILCFPSSSITEAAGEIMKTLFNVRAVAITCTILCIGIAAYARTHSRINNKFEKDTKMTNHAQGTFEVKMTPQEDTTMDANMGRMTGDKQLHGDIEGSGKSQ